MSHYPASFFRFGRRAVLLLVAAILAASLIVPGFSSTSGFRTAQATGFDCITVTDIPASECSVLVALYNNTNGSGWFNAGQGWSNNWELTSTVCSWYGVICLSGYVSQLNLGFTRLTGMLPNLNGLSHLTILNLENNYLSGSIPIPNGLTNLLDLNLRINQLSGSIPSLTGMTNLKRLDLSDNQLSGPIPVVNIPTSLQYLDLDTNQLSGSVPSLVGLANLQTFNLSVNQLSGLLPAVNASTNLQALDLSGNQLSGTIASLTGLTNLQVLNLNNNQLSGTMPSLSGLTNLTQLNLSFNQLSGSIPSLSGLSGLQNLFLSFNQLSGSIPTLSGLTNLGDLYLGNNQLSGSIPSLSGLTNLFALYLENNQLNRSIPSLSGLTSLYYLHLENNQLNGSIPDLPAHLTNMSVANNMLSGSIPDSLRNTWVTVGNLQLCGGGNSLVPATPAVNAFIASVLSNWTGQCTSTPSVTDTIGIYRGGTFYMSLHNQTGNADIVVGFNPPGKNFPIVGDWTGAGFDTIGVFNQNTGRLSLRNSNTAGTADESFTLGIPNDTHCQAAGRSTRLMPESASIVRRTVFCTLKTP